MGMGMGMMGISSSDLLLINDIQTAVILEVQAFNYYQRLMALTANEQQRQIITSIQRDEMRHYHWFTMMLRMMGAQQPLIPPGELPVNFVEGTREAIRLELEAAVFYQTIANRATAHFIRMHTTRAIYDEQRHATLLQNILISL
ncbi:ferritin family protein [Acetivibrio cellulolyticus]|uniref:ferritin family protein n=1 Tax=Acetivibrio cellulolyticus TaxID=35830 RepID=UPI0002481AD8|nr:ferritin-like domain-containing protein [Acetivibrio cellulolyticus]